jgi:hypothetical protein
VSLACSSRSEPGSGYGPGDLDPCVVVPVRQRLEMGYERVQLGALGLQKRLAMERGGMTLIRGGH